MANLTKHDLDVLEKIKDPEAGPSNPLLIDDSLPRDPHVTDASSYQALTQRERAIILGMQDISSLDQYLSSVRLLDALIEEHPNYASARNNRAQALRRIYGDSMLVTLNLTTRASDSTLISISSTVLSDLDTAIKLLSPSTPWAALSPQAAKTLANALTQRGALYHLSAKQLSSSPDANLRIDEKRREAKWKTINFEECASRDFMLGGRYGNEIAKALAVSANPTAKLCGDMVRQAMRREIAGVGGN
ncbi:Tetratricopeptide repeat 36 protein [Rutstroemia sp. NJR-2017a BBW]|nr:Tetratricopeptide repeat 36 protein [Rutstroemia sp. NJR-2017a BBW]